MSACDLPYIFIDLSQTGMTTHDNAPSDDSLLKKSWTISIAESEGEVRGDRDTVS